MIDVSMFACDEGYKIYGEYMGHENDNFFRRLPATSNPMGYFPYRWHKHANNIYVHIYLV